MALIGVVESDLFVLGRNTRRNSGGAARLLMRLLFVDWILVSSRVFLPDNRVGIFA